MRRLIAVLGVLAVAATPARTHAWGYDAHKFIMERAIGLLPGEIRPFFEQYKSMLVERAIDPDTWQVAGFDDQEDPNHFIDLDWEGYGKYPFDGLPRDYFAAVAKFGKERVDDNGTLPWRTEEMHGNLRRAFEAYERRGPFGRFDIIFFSAWLTHYVSDAHVPFHAVLNYDGQLTGQPGLHTRFEAYLFERYRDQWTIAPKPMRPIKNPRDYIFEAALQGTQMVQAILKADLDAIGTREEYDDVYYAAFFKANRAVVERRLNESIAASAAMIAGAWEAAGKPAVPVSRPATPQGRRR